MCTCAAAEPQWHWAKGRQDGWRDRCRSIGLTPAVGGAGMQIWRIVSVDGGPLVPGAVVTMQNTGRTACGGYIAAPAARCGSGRVLLTSDGQAASAPWVLRAGPKPLSFLLEAQSTSWYCPRRWLGAPRRCGSDSLGLYAATDTHAALVWLVLPA